MRPDGRDGWVPVLLERFPAVGNGDVAPDGSRITYRIRDGISWADGMPANLEYTWQVLSDERNEVICREGLEHFKAVEMVDSRTAVLNLDRPYAP